MYVLGLFTLSLLGLGVKGVSAWGYPPPPPPMVEIGYANYLDLDGDGIEDDILTNFTIYDPYWSISNYYGQIRLYMVLPSGFTWYIEIDIDWYISETKTLHVEWHNCATESGWYDFYVYLDAYVFLSNGGLDYVYEYDYLEFDPPEKGADIGEPFAYYY